MEKAKKQNLWFLAGLFGIGLILFWRCFYSVNTTDEAFYIGTVYRLWYGDGMLTDEWMPTQQMCSFWLIPFFALFRLILGSNEGMMLAFRFLYIVSQLLISSYLYLRLKKYGSMSIFAGFFFLLSTAFNINSLSYNTMANSCLVALLATLAVMEKPDWKNCIWCGFFASVVVMANPYAVFAYILYGAACVIATLLGKNKEISAAVRFQTFFKISVTAALIFVIFAIYVLQNSTLEQIIKNLPYIVGDQEHQQRWGVKFTDYFRYFKEHYFACCAVPILSGLAASLDKKRISHGKYYMAVSVLAVLPYMIYHGLISDYVPVNLVTVPICFLGIPAYVLSKKRLTKVFYIWYLPALVLYPFIVQITSNTGPLAVSAAFMSAGAAAVCLISTWAKEQEGKFWRMGMHGIILLQLLMMLILRITFVWADEPLAELTTKVNRGAAKGIYTTAEDEKFYDEIYDDLDALNMTADDDFLVVGSDPLLYLYADKEVAAYSTWQVFTNETRLYRYYEIHDGEGKFPSVVYCVEAGEEIFDSILVEKLLLPMGYEYKQLQHGIAFYTPR